MITLQKKGDDSMLQELIDGYFVLLGVYTLFKLAHAGVLYIKDIPESKREREEYLREMGRLTN